MKRATSYLLLLTLLMPELKADESKDTIIRLKKADLFVMIEYNATEYEQLSANNATLPADYSFVSYYVDINGNANAKNVEDVNYLFLNEFSNPKVDSGYLYYLIPAKTKPMTKRKTNIRSSKTVDRFFDINTINDIVFGYWKRDTLKDKVFFIFRESTGIDDMSNLRVFSGLVINQNIFVTHAMNTKDDYLFDFKFKNNKELTVKLPIELNNVFYSQVIADDNESTVLQEKLVPVKMNGDRQSVAGTIETAMKASVKYWRYTTNSQRLYSKGLDLLDYDSLSFHFVKCGLFGVKKSVLLAGWKNNVPTYQKIKLPNYYKYFYEDDYVENIFIDVEDPYAYTRRGQESEAAKHRFYLPYHKKTLLRKLKTMVMKLA